MRRFTLWLAALLVLAILVGPSTAGAFQNGRAGPSDLAPIFIPNNTASLAKHGGAAASMNTMRMCAAAEGVDLYPSVSQGHPAWTAYRNIAAQVALWQRFQNGTGALAARPGTSNHGFGRAEDLALVRMRTWIDHNGRAFGWAKVEAFNEWWHVNYVGGFHRPDPGLSLRFPNLRLHSGGRCQSVAVKEVQRRLGLAQDGDYGKATRRAVKRFQREQKITVDGRVGSDTWLRLRKVSRGVPKHDNARTVGNAGEVKGVGGPMAGQDVRAVQGLLNAKFVELHRPQYRIKVDGLTDARFTVAVKRFQRLRHLPRTGVVDDRTYAELIKKVVPDTPKLIVTEAGTNLVAGFEGERLCPYLDTIARPPVWTQGFGHTSAAGAPSVSSSSRCWSHAEAVAFLHRDLDHYAVGVAKLIKSRTSLGEFNGMVSLSFNVGIGGFGGSTLLRAHNAEHYIAAARQFAHWNHAGGRVVLGLTRRRRAECVMYVAASSSAVKAAHPC